MFKTFEYFDPISRPFPRDLKIREQRSRIPNWSHTQAGSLRLRSMERGLHTLGALGPRAADNIAAWHTGSESDTVNPLTRLPMYFYSEPSRIIVATLPGSPWHSYHQKYRVGKPARAQKPARSPPLARATHSPALERTSLLRETSKSYVFPPAREIGLLRTVRCRKLIPSDDFSDLNKKTFGEYLIPGSLESPLSAYN